MGKMGRPQKAQGKRSKRTYSPEALRLKDAITGGHYKFFRGVHFADDHLMSEVIQESEPCCPGGALAIWGVVLHSERFLHHFGVSFVIDADDAYFYYFKDGRIGKVLFGWDQDKTMVFA